MGFQSRFDDVIRGIGSKKSNHMPNQGLNGRPGTPGPSYDAHFLGTEHSGPSGGPAGAPTSAQVLLMKNPDGSAIVIYFRGRTELGVYPANEISGLYGIFDELSAGWQADAVKDLTLFKSLFCVRQRPIPYRFNGQDGHAVEETIPCNCCGVILPRDLISIDTVYRRLTWHMAALKVFRHLGLTDEGPKGARSNAVMSALLDGGTTILEPEGHGLMLRKSAKVSLRSLAERRNDAKYTLSPMGIAVYSIMVKLSDNSFLMEAFLNNLLNLRPLCPACSAFGSHLYEQKRH